MTDDLWSGWLGAGRNSLLWRCGRLWRRRKGWKLGQRRYLRACRHIGKGCGRRKRHHLKYMWLWLRPESLDQQIKKKSKANGQM
jgi:hypothetical protein